MPRSPQEFERIREQSREKILDCALRLFAQRGYAGTSIRMLADEAGISQGLLYNYFEGKQALVRALFWRSVGVVEATLARAARAKRSSDSIALLIRSAFDAVRANEAFWRLTYQLRMQPEVLADLSADVRVWSEQIRGRIEVLLEAGRVPRAGLRARVIFAAIDGAAQHWVLDPEGYPLDEVADEMIRLLSPAATRRGSL